MSQARRLSALLISFSIGCAGGPAADDEPVDCSGSCDLFRDLKRRIQDAASIKFDKLLLAEAGWVSDEVNQRIHGGLVGQALDYEADVFDGASLADLSGGIVGRFGEHELSSQVALVRQQQLADTADQRYLETSFAVPKQLLDAGWQMPVAGLHPDSAVRTSVGFTDGAAVSTRMVTLVSADADAARANPAQAIRDARSALPQGSFLLPRNLDDVRALQPGESFGLQAQGRVGINLGVRTPWLLALYGAYHLVFSAALSTRITGLIDVQLVRLSGDQFVVDVGAERASVEDAFVAVQDGFGAPFLSGDARWFGFGHMRSPIDLNVVAQKGFEALLHRKISFFGARAEAADGQTRMTLARLRFTLPSQGDTIDTDLVGQALAQALHGDVRLAQALANRGEPGVVCEFDLFRGGAASVSRAGFHLFGLRFYRDVLVQQGDVVLQTPGGVRTFLFDSLRKVWEKRHSSHGYKRVGLSGLVFDDNAARAQDAAHARGEVNFFVQIQEGADTLARDTLLDHLDGLIGATTGADGLATIASVGDPLQVTADRCRDDACVVATLADSAAKRQGALAQLGVVAGGLEPSLLDLVTGAAQLRLAGAARKSLPAGTVSVEYRLDEQTLRAVLQAGRGADLAGGAAAFLGAAQVKRGGSDPASARASAIASATGRVAPLGTLFDASATRYAQLVDVETNARLADLGEPSDLLELQLPVRSDMQADYDHVTADSIPHLRAQVVLDLYDALLRAVDASALGKPAEQVIAYALLSMVNPASLDLRFDVQMGGLPDGFGTSGLAPTSRPARGSAVARIDGGLFNVDDLAPQITDEPDMVGNED
jgi:hypothetical protein